MQSLKKVHETNGGRRPGWSVEGAGSRRSRASTACLVVGRDVEWRPNFHHNLQQCVARRCLVFQILHALLVFAFLHNRSHEFVQVGIESDVEKPRRVTASRWDTEWLSVKQPKGY
uniref:Uncharacterized protein n=1 Tax=Kalanchoe fedtschenkoi TaxID=63787 RepID=A0A7N0V3T1_KALFE